MYTISFKLGKRGHQYFSGENWDSAMAVSDSAVGLIPACTMNGLGIAAERSAARCSVNKMLSRFRRSNSTSLADDGTHTVVNW
jgi:hypothetical protein